MDSVIQIETITKMERALILEAMRRLASWWPEDESTFWLTRLAHLAVLGTRAELPGVSPEGRAMLQNTLDRFNETADLSDSAFIPPGWKPVPCIPTEEMILACMAIYRGRFTRPAPKQTMGAKIKARLARWWPQMQQFPGDEKEHALQWLGDHRSEICVNYQAMVDVAPLLPWMRA